MSLKSWYESFGTDFESWFHLVKSAIGSFNAQADPGRRDQTCARLLTLSTKLSLQPAAPDHQVAKALNKAFRAAARAAQQCISGDYVAATTSIGVVAGALQVAMPLVNSAVGTAGWEAPIDGALLQSMGICSSRCVITGRVHLTHPVWGPYTLVTTQPSLNAMTLGDAHIAAIDAQGRARWSATLPRMIGLKPARPAVDRLGHIFLNAYPGNISFLVVLRPIASGFADYGSLPIWRDRFAPASATDINRDGIFEIDRNVDDCNPNCASGNTTHTIFRWNGSNYTRMSIT
jgi:hypothetical protein